MADQMPRRSSTTAQSSKQATPSPKMMGQRPSSNLPRRDRTNREHFAHFDIYDQPFDYDLNIDPRITPHFIDSRFIRTFDSRRPFPSRRVTEVGRPSRQMTMEQRLDSVSLKDVEPFGRAMRNLHTQVEAAETFYQGMQQEFDSETTAMKKYATEELLTELWQNRVNGKRDPRLEAEDTNDDDSFRETKVLFMENRKKLEKALAVALQSSAKIEKGESKKSRGRCEEARRLQKKVCTTAADILDLLIKVTMERDDCEALLRELGGLKKLIDPDDDENRRLYKIMPEDDEDDSSSTVGNTGRED